MSFNAISPFALPPLPPPVDFKNPLFFDKLLKARTQLAELNGYTLALPNPLLLLSPAILKESLASSEIENIHTTLIEALQNQLFPESKRKVADKEVLRYRKAILWAHGQLGPMPICTRLIQGIQQTLIPAGQGQYRRQQNQIANTATNEVLYTPPPAAEIPRLLSNWENFVNQEPETLDPLIKSAAAHYQFEAIHPFIDGNGRTGRILMVLQLIQDKILQLPVLYVSGYINKNRSEYYRLLNAVTRAGEWNGFILFILEAFHSQAKETVKLLLAIRSLFEAFKEEIQKKIPKIYSGDLVEKLFSFPVLTPVSLGEKLNIHYTTASRYLKNLSQNGFLKSSRVGRHHFFINENLMKILA